MKLADLTGWVVASARDDSITAADLLRALREQSTHFDPDKSASLKPDILHGARRGPLGGLDADPFRAAFVLIAVMLSGRRSDIAGRVWKAWHMHHEAVRTGAFREHELEQIDRGGACPLTGQRLFGGALQAILADEDLARRIERIRIAGDLFGEIEGEGGVVSKFGTVEYRRQPPPLIRCAELDGLIIAGMGALLKR